VTQSIVSGTYSEDFNYGYPYNNPLRPTRTLPPQFVYNNAAATPSGYYVSSPRFVKLGRAAYSLCYLSKAQEPNNIDLGAHSGAHNASPYYLLFPPLSWDECVLLELTITTTADGAALTYDRSFDGVVGDRFLLLVNGKEQAVYHRTAGYNWTTDITYLRKGRNTIRWIVKTKKYTPPVLRNGTTVTNITPPKVTRYFRLCRLSVTSVSVFPGGTVGNYGSPPYAELGSNAATDIGSVTFAGRKGLRGKAVLKGYATVGYKAKSARSDITGVTTPTFTSRQNTNAKAAFFGDSAFGPTGAISFTHSAWDFQMELNTSGALTVEIPFNTPQNVSSLIRNLQSVALTMSAPVFVNGKPVTPRYQDTQNFSASTTGAYVYTDPVSPNNINHLLPITPTYRWITTDISGADDSQVTSWPEHVTPATNPAWTSNAAYGPTVHPHERFVDREATYLTYSRTLHFYDFNGEHMWLSMPATAFPTTVTNVTPYQPYTWMFVAMLHPIIGGRDQAHTHTLLDAFPNSTTPPDYSQQIADDEYTLANDGTGAYRSTIMFQPGRALMSSNTSTTLVRPWIMNYKPCVYFGVFNGANSVLSAFGENYYQRITGPTGAGSNYQQGFMMGRTNGFFDRLNFTTMTLMETAFYNRVLTTVEQRKIADYLAAVYQFQRYR
jgi:hypothetical protein